MRRGKEFEELTARLLEAAVARDGNAIVERDVQVPGPDRDRQIDVLVRTRSGPFELVTIVECKDQDRVVSVPAVDALDSVARDLKASKAVLVSRKGFTRGARREAERLGIGLFRADSADGLVDMAFDVPVLVEEYAASNLSVTFTSTIDGTRGGSVEFIEVIDAVVDSKIPSLVRAEVDRMIADGEVGDGRLTVRSEELDTPILVPHSEGGGFEVEEIEIGFSIEARHFQGHLSDLETEYLLDEMSEQVTALIHAERLDLDYREGLPEFTSGPAPGTAPLLVISASRPVDRERLSSIDGELVVTQVDGAQVGKEYMRRPVRYRRDR